MAVARLENGDQELAEGDYAQAQSSYRESERFFERARRLKAATEKIKALIIKANAAGQNAANIRRKAEESNAEDYAAEAYSYGLNQERNGGEYIASENYSGAIIAFDEAIKGYERALFETATFGKAESLYEKGDYEKSLIELKAALSESFYEGENQKALAFMQETERAQNFRDGILTTSQQAIDNGNLEAALENLDALSEREQNSSFVKAFKDEIVKNDQTPPEILHTPEAEYQPKKPIIIRANVRDNLKVKQVVLNYQKKGEKEYQAVEMKFKEGESYEFSIGVEYHRYKEIRYYISATDINANKSTLGTKDEPFKIKVPIKELQF